VIGTLSEGEICYRSSSFDEVRKKPHRPRPPRLLGLGVTLLESRRLAFYGLDGSADKNGKPELLMAISCWSAMSGRDGPISLDRGHRVAVPRT